MNERIKELFDEAANYAMKNTKFHIDHEREEWQKDVDNLSKEKFAELIVRECAKIADDGCGSACFGLGINGAMLLEHFGIDQ